MKILFFCIRFPLASETFVLNQVVSFIKMGYEVSILSVYPGDLDKLHSDYINYDIANKVSYIFEKDLSSKNKFYQLGYRALYSLSALIRGGFSAFNAKSFSFLTYSLLLPSLVGRINKKIESDVIISHFGPCGVLANSLRHCGILTGKIVTVFHGYDLSATSLLNRYSSSYRQLFIDGEHFLPVSLTWKNKLIEMGCDKSKITIIRMGIKVDDFIYSPRTFDNKCLKIISVCRLTEKKGLSYAIQACDILNKAGYNFEYTIVGYGDLLESLQILINRLNLESKIKIVGFQPQSSVKTMLMHSDVFLLPSITADNGDMEGIPVALMEAMAIGLPVISTYHSGIPELIDNDVSGWLCTERNFHEIAEILISIVKRERNLKFIEDNARSKIETSFNQVREYEKMAELLEHIR
ncbi:TPA: glycosyltransferase [Raoultella ornithinolytica]|nr:glycosyltransferase [Raoultella ornithinolytica]